MTEDICTACEGTGKGLAWYPANTKLIEGLSYPHCKYCDGTGKRQEQIFNWLKDDQPEKYIKKG